MIRKLDRYVIVTFILALGVSTLVLAGLYMIVHFFTSLSDFIAIRQEKIFLFIIQYYFYRFPLILLELLPIITLIAAMLTVTQLIRRNELVPIFSAGISIYRVLRPIFILAALISVLMFVMDEKVVPLLTYSLSKTDKILESEGMGRYLILRNQNDSVVIEGYNYIKKRMYDVTVTKYSPSGEVQSQIFAQKGNWVNPTRRSPVARADEGNGNIGWHFSNGVIYFYDADGHRKGPPFYFGREGFRPALTLKPEDLDKTEATISYAEMAELQKLIQEYPHQVYLKVRLYQKIASPLSNFILLMLGLPFILMGETRNFWAGSAICLFVSLAYFMTRFLAEELGLKAVLSPQVATGLPLVLFGLIALGLARKIRT